LTDSGDRLRRWPAGDPVNGLLPFALNLHSLSYAILALLAGKPQSGYDLSRQMKPPLGYMWQAKHGQIYPELSRLVAAGLVQFRRVDKKLGPPRRVHSITRAGKAELAKWVIAPPNPRPMNDELVVKAYALLRAQPKAAGELLAEQMQLHEHRLAALEQLSRAILTDTGSPSDLDATKFGEYATLRHAIGMERELLAWCRWLYQRLPSRAQPRHRPENGQDRGSATGSKTRRVRKGG
jgi:DNA-binding PadR family transcriptional regulator